MPNINEILLNSFKNENIAVLCSQKVHKSTEFNNLDGSQNFAVGRFRDHADQIGIVKFAGSRFGQA